MPEADVDHIYDYPKGYIKDILKSVKTIAMVGASGDKTKFSYGVLRVLHETGYEMLPVNPNPCLLYTSPSPRDGLLSRMPSSA